VNKKQRVRRRPNANTRLACLAALELDGVALEEI